MASTAVQDSFVSRDEARKQKQLADARASGQAAAEIDEITGKMINPHNPQFLTKAPWYLNQNAPSLKHQNAWNKKTEGTKEWYTKGTKGDVKTKFLKGACENCGATTHKAKDCVERPRKVGAKFTGKDLKSDEYIETFNFDWEGKRDRWNGFEADDYKEVMQEWEAADGERKRLKAQEMEDRAKMKERLRNQKKALKKKRKQRRKQLKRIAEGRGTDDGTDSDTDGASDTDTDSDTDSDASDDEDLGEKMKDFDKTTTTVGMKDEKLRTTTRNLRIREDTAKYLLNLDRNSAFYDPKSRSMRDNPHKHLKEDDQGPFRGDNWTRNTGDAKKMTELMIYAWDSYKRGEKVHDLAQPTQAAKMHDIFKNRSKDLKQTQQKELVEKYGGTEHLDAPRELLFSQSDQYVEYSRDGRVLKGREREYAKSKYEEDILIGNHSSPWGSWYDKSQHKWGFACCHQTLQSAYCVPLKVRGSEEGSDGIAAIGEASEVGAASSSAAPAAGAVASAVDSGATGSDTKPATPASGSAANATTDGGQEAVVEVAGNVSSSSGSSSSEDDGEDGETKTAKQKARALKGLKIYGKRGEKRTAEEATEHEERGGGDKKDDSKLSDKRSSAFGHNLEDIEDFDQKKLKEAVAKEKKRQKKEKGKGAFTVDDERKRGYNSFAGDNDAVNAEEFEAYRLTKQRADDPMAQFK